MIDSFASTFFPALIGGYIGSLITQKIIDARAARRKRRQDAAAEAAIQERINRANSGLYRGPGPNLQPMGKPKLDLYSIRFLLLLACVSCFIAANYCQP